MKGLHKCLHNALYNALYKSSCKPLEILYLQSPWKDIRYLHMLWNSYYILILKLNFKSRTLWYPRYFRYPDFPKWGIQYAVYNIFSLQHRLVEICYIKFSMTALVLIKKLKINAKRWFMLQYAIFHIVISTSVSYRWIVKRRRYGFHNMPNQ